jgi:hypothetical protein
MGIRSFSFVPQTLTEWGRFFRDAQVEVTNGTIIDASFEDRQAHSVIGRKEATQGVPADILSSADNQFLVRRTGVLGFGGVVDADLPATIARDTEVVAGDAAVTAAFIAADAIVSAAYIAADAAHVAASDPHTGYRLESANVPYSEISSVPAALSRLYTGTGTPESVVTAGVGSLFLRTDGGASTSLYVKESGAGNTGWVGK